MKDMYKILREDPRLAMEVTHSTRAVINLMFKFKLTDEYSTLFNEKEILKKNYSSPEDTSIWFAARYIHREHEFYSMEMLLPFVKELEQMYKYDGICV